MAGTTRESVIVIGAGSWGTALAIQLARGGQRTQLWGRDLAQLDAMRRARCNERYLPDAVFPPSLEIALDLDSALRTTGDALIAVPSHAFRGTLELLKPLLSEPSRIAWATCCAAAWVSSQWLLGGPASASSTMAIPITAKAPSATTEV